MGYTELLYKYLMVTNKKDNEKPTKKTHIHNQ